MGGTVGKESSLTEHFSNMGMLHCAMIGLDLSGKTTVLYRMKFNQYMNTATTIGFNCEKVRLNNKNYMIWDVGGQDKLRPLWRSYTRATDGIIFVVDSSKADRFEEAKLELQKIFKCCQTTGVKSGNGTAPILVLANKQDLPNAADSAKIEAVLGLRELGASFWHVQSTCAVTGEGLEEGMAQLTEMIAMRKNKSHPSRMTSSNSLKPPNTQPQTPSSPSSSSANGGSGGGSSSSKSSRKVQRSQSHHY